MRFPTLTAACAALVLALAPAVAQAADEPATLAIDGTGIALVAPDVATLSVDVRSSGATRQSARRKCNARTKRVLAALVKQGVPRADLQTAGVSLERVRVEKKVRYNAANAITVRLTNVAKVGPVVDAVTKAGADGIDGPSFSFKDPSTGKAEATRAAMADARRRADDAAAAVGMHVTGIRSIVIDPASAPGSASGGTGATRSSSPAFTDAEPTDVSPGREEVTVTVEVIYAIAP